MVVNSIIAASWDIAERFSEDANIVVYNFENSQAPVMPSMIVLFFSFYCFVYFAEAYLGWLHNDVYTERS